jgi:hypothetical protein
MTPLAANILLVFCSVMVGILAVGGDTCRHEGQHRRITARGWWSILFLCAGLVLGAYKEIVSARETADLSAKLEKARSAPLNFSELREIDVGMSIDRVIEKFGPAAIVRTQSFLNCPTLHYARWRNRALELQTLSASNKQILAFTVRLFDPTETYAYTNTPVRWNLGSSSFADIVPTAEAIFRSGDAKFVSYVEQVYFGRWGNYNDFYFCANDPGKLPNSPPKLNRGETKPIAVCVTTRRIQSMEPNIRPDRWREIVVHFVGLYGARFEESY